MFLGMAPHAKSSYVVRSLMAGLAVVALSACTSTAPAPEPTGPSADGDFCKQLLTSARPRPQTSAASSESTSSGSQSPAETTFSADSIKVLEHKIIDDPMAKNLQVKVQAPENTSFFSGTDKAPCEASVIDLPSAAPSSSAATSVPKADLLAALPGPKPHHGTDREHRLRRFRLLIRCPAEVVLSLVAICWNQPEARVWCGGWASSENGQVHQ